MKKVTLTALVLIALALLNSPAYATDITISNTTITPFSAWLNEDVTISTECNATNLTVEAYANITYPSGFTTTKSMNEYAGGYRTAFKPPMLGAYTVNAFCIANSTTANETSSFTTSDLEISIKEISPSTIYSDSYVSEKVNLSITLEGTSPVKNNVEWKVYVDGQEISLPEGNEPYWNEFWIIDIGNGALSAGSHDVKIKAAYRGNAVEATKSISVLKPLDVSITPSETEFSAENNITVSVNAKYRNSAILLTDSGIGINVQLGSSLLEFSVKSAAELEVRLPEKNPGKYELTVELSYDGVSGSDTKDVYYLLELEGELLDGGKSPVSGKLEFEDSDVIRTIDVKSGKYSGGIPPGTYTMRLKDFKGLESAVFSEVEIDSDMNDFIRYDELSEQEMSEGIKSVGGIVIELVPDFSKATLRIKYDASQVEYENELVLYICNEWNIDSGKCSGSWSEVDAFSFDNNKIKNSIEIETDYTAAFIIGEQDSLNIQARADKSSYKLKENMEITGIVKNSDGIGVPNASIEYSFNGFEGEVLTDGDGVFYAKINSPDSSGNYTLDIIASKGVFRDGSESLSIKVAAEKRLSILPPYNAAVPEGSNATFNIKLKNTGQTQFRDIEILIYGPEGKNVDYFPQKITALNVGDEKEVALEVKSEDFEKGMKTFYVNVFSSGINKTESFQISFKETGKIETSEAQESQSVVSSITGMFAGVSSGTGFVSVIDSFSFVLSFGIIAILIKRIRNRKKGVSRDVVAAGHIIKHELMKSDFSIKNKVKKTKKKAVKRKRNERRDLW